MLIIWYEGEHARPRSADDGRDALLSQVRHKPCGVRHGCRSVSLVQPVFGGLEKHAGRAGQRADEQRRACRVERGVRERNGGRKHGPRLCGISALHWYEDHGQHSLSIVQPQRPGAAMPGCSPVPGDGKAAKHARRDIVRMALDLGGKPDNGRIIKQRWPTIQQLPREQDAGHDRRRRRTKAAGLRNGVLTSEFEPGRPIAQSLEDIEHRRRDQVPLVGGQFVGALPSDTDAYPVSRYPGCDCVV